MIRRWLGILLARRRIPERPAGAPPEGEQMDDSWTSRDERMLLLGQRLGQAKKELSLVEAEVQALRVDSGVVSRDYQPPPRRAREGEGSQPV